MNRFERLISDRKICSVLDLKRAFWRLARDCHPNGHSTAASEELFCRLKDEFDDALESLRNADPIPPPTPASKSASDPAAREPYSRDACVEAFGDLLASSFPIDPNLDPVPRGYTLARDRFLRLYSRRGHSARDLFLQFERDLYEIRGDNIVMNPLFGKIKLILFNIPSAHFGGSFSRRAIARWLEELGSEESDRDTSSDVGWASGTLAGEHGYPSIIQFIETLAF